MATQPSTTRDHTYRERFLASLSTSKARLAITVGPGMVWLFVFLLAPLVFLVAVSFTITGSDYQIIWEFTAANYSDLLTREDMAFWETPFFRSMVLSYFIGAATTITTLLATFPVAYLLAKKSGRFFRIFIYLVLLPFFTVYIVRAYSWFLILGENGVANQVLITIGIVNEPITVLNFGTSAIIIGLTHAYFPYMLLTLYASLDGIDFSLMEAARDLGATRVDTLRDVIIPLTLPGIISGTVFVFVPAIGAFLTPEILGRAKVLMIGQLITTRVNSMYAIGYGSAAAMFIIVSIVIAFIFAFRYVSIEDLGGEAS